MRIGLIDIDSSNYPNLPLMKLSAYYKQRGDNVEWYTPFAERYDMVYVAKVFSWSEDYPYYINANRVVKGGSGYLIRTIDGKEGYYPFRAHLDSNHKGFTFMDELPHEVEHIYPDYSLYPKYTQDTAYGFLTRGCPRGCSFCHVAMKEGMKSVKVADLSEFWHGQHNIVLCDPNLLACKDCEPLLQQLIDSRANIDFNQGLDARMMTQRKAEMLGEIKVKEIHFAWDRYEEGEQVLKGLRIYEQYAKNRPHQHNAIVYTIVNYDTTIEQDLDRIYRLRDAGYWAYICVYDKKHAARIYKDLMRWCNNRVIFAAEPDFNKYNKQPKTSDNDIITCPTAKKKLIQTRLEL